MSGILTGLREWASRDAWLTFDTDADDGIMHDEDCTDANLKMHM